MDFNDILTRLKAHPGDPSLTITTNAARTYMDAGLTREHLRKLEHEAEKVLLEHYDKRTAMPVIERSRALIGSLNKVSHLPGLALFVNQELSELVHLPFDVEEQVTVGSTFFTRELLRTGLESISYHVLVLGSEQAKLFEANDAHLVDEVRGDLPVKNRHYTTDASQITNAPGRDNQQRKFHQEVDDAVHAVVGDRGHVVVACVDERHGHFMKDAPHPELYQEHLSGNFDHVATPELIARAWELVQAAQQHRHLKELDRAANGASGLFSTAPDEIWTHVSEGRGKVLFVERDLHLPAIFEDDHVVLMEPGGDHQPGIDLVDALIEEQVEHGGEVRILPNGSMGAFDGLALKTRY